jgi:glycine/D-amino acid oxidase-like deaminating enzyme
MFDLTGSRHYVSGLYTPGTVMLQPAGFVRGFGEGLRAAGVGVWENTPVTAIEGGAAGWTVTTPRGRLTAGKVILANNGHLESFGFARKPADACVPLCLDDGGPAGRDAEETGRRSPAGASPPRIRWAPPCAGSTPALAATASSPAPAPASCRGWSLGGRAETHRRRPRQKFADRFPALAGVRQEYTWAGHLCLARNGTSIARELEPGLYAASVCNGLGTARSTLTGMAAAELAMGQATDATRHFAAEAQPVKLPPKPFSTLGANLFLRWKEWRAGKGPSDQARRAVSTIRPPAVIRAVPTSVQRCGTSPKKTSPRSWRRSCRRSRNWPPPRGGATDRPPPRQWRRRPSAAPGCR